MATEWYYQEKGESIGPNSGSKLRSLADSETVMPWTPVRRIHNKERSPWTRAGAIKALFPNDVNKLLGPTICDECGTAKPDGVCPSCEGERIDRVSTEPPPLVEVPKPPPPLQPVERRYPKLRNYIEALYLLGFAGLLITGLIGVTLSVQAISAENWHRLALGLLCILSGGLTLLVAVASAEFLQLAIDVEEDLRELLAESRRNNDSEDG